ncbi:MAG: photosynthetic complex assembly protein PuhC [Pseudomonadota bacterium]
MTSLRAASPLSTSSPWAAWLLAAMVVSTLLAVSWLRISGASITEPAAAVQWSRMLNFEDRPNGDVAVLDATTGAEVARFKGEQGFVRGTLRALARERKRRDMGPALPFELTGHVDGRLTLTDTATGLHVALESFGPSNSGVFARLRDAVPTPAVKVAHSSQTDRANLQTQQHVAEAAPSTGKP